MADPVQDALLGDTSGSDVEPRLSSAELCGVDDTARLRWDGPRRRVAGRQQPPAHGSLATDHDAIICLMTDRLARGPDQDVHVPSVDSPKYPSRRVDVIYLYLTIVRVV